jgi:hypothetical protein
LTKEKEARKVARAQAQAGAKLLAEHQPLQMRSTTQSRDLESPVTFIDDESDSGGAKLAPTPVKPLRVAAGDNAAKRAAEDAQQSLRERLKGAKAATPANAVPLAGSVFSASSAAAYVESIRSFREPADVALSLSAGLSGGLSSGLELGNGAMDFAGRGFGTGLSSISFALGATSVGNQSKGRAGELDTNRGSAI